jgi:hypothetical protein
VDDRNDVGKLDLGVVDHVAVFADEVAPPVAAVFVYGAAPSA